MNDATKKTRTLRTPEEWNQMGENTLHGLLGIEIISVDAECLKSRLPVRQNVMAANGFLHAATVIALADTTCGYGTVTNLPENATGFTTIELKSNFLGTARAGVILCEAKPLHRGRSTQLWDAEVSDQEGRILAHFRCTQMILWPQGD